MLRRLITCWLLTASVGLAQTHLREGTTIAVSNLGLYVVPPSAAGTPNDDVHRFRVAEPADFGLAALTGARVEWLAGTDLLIVSTTSSPSGPGHLYRVALEPGGERVARVETLAEGNFKDLKPSGALDVLFLLDAQAGAVVALPDPAHADAAALDVRNDGLPGGGAARALALLPAELPFAVLVVDDTSFWRVPMNGAPAQALYGNGGGVLGDVASHPWLPEWYALSTGGDLFGLPVVNLLTGDVSGVLQANSAGAGSFCEPADGPVDFVSDVRADGHLQGFVVVSNAVAPCVFGGAAQGKNHVLRFPLATPVGGSGFPVLHTALPVSGIGGTKPDLALVRRRVPEIASVGGPLPAPGGAHAPVAGLDVAQGVVRATLTGAPGDVAVQLALRVLEQPGPVDAQPAVFREPHGLLLATTDADGATSIVLQGPATAGALAGGARRLVLQWALPDGSLSQKLLVLLGEP